MNPNPALLNRQPIASVRTHDQAIISTNRQKHECQEVAELQETAGASNRKMSLNGAPISKRRAKWSQLPVGQLTLALVTSALEFGCRPDGSAGQDPTELDAYALRRSCGYSQDIED